MRNINKFLILFFMLFMICMPMSAHAAEQIQANGQLDTNKHLVITTDKAVPSSAQLYVMQVFQDLAEGIALPVTMQNGQIITDLYLDGKSLLSCKFCFAKETDNGRVQVSNTFYISNPEILSINAPARHDNGIKGLLPASTNADEYRELGIKQLLFNMELGEIISKSSSKDCIEWHVDDKKYYFKKSRLEEYDRFVRWCNDNGFQLTMTLLNAKNSKQINLIHPDAWDGTDCATYAFNTATEDGVATIKAAATFLAKRYSGGEYGVIDNWIIDSQINCRTEWYYFGSSDLEANVKEYIKAYRIFYNEIKAVNKNADIYIALDQEWNRKSNPGCFLAREYLSRFAYWINKEGNIDYAVSVHPYNAPLYDPYAWIPQEEHVKNTPDTPYLTMSNIDLFINEMKQEKYLDTKGNIRHLMITEVGFSSAESEEAQAASVAYAYIKASQYPEIRGFILYRDVDEAGEVLQGLANGLKTLDGKRKLSWEFYRTVGTPAFNHAKFKQITKYDIKTLVNTWQTRQGWELDDNAETTDQ